MSEEWVLMWHWFKDTEGWPVVREVVLDETGKVKVFDSRPSADRYRARVCIPKAHVHDHLRFSRVVNGTMEFAPIDDPIARKVSVMLWWLHPTHPEQFPQDEPE